MKAITSRAVLASRVRSDCKKLLPAWRQHGVVGKQIERWFADAAYGFGGGHCCEAKKADRAAWLRKLESVVEWSESLSNYKNGKRREALKGLKIRTFTAFARSARYAVREGEPVVLFDFDGGQFALEVNVEHEVGGAYSVDGWGSVLDTKSLYFAALFLYVEAVDELCDEYRRWCEERHGC